MIVLGLKMVFSVGAVLTILMFVGVVSGMLVYAVVHSYTDELGLTGASLLLVESIPYVFGVVIVLNLVAVVMLNGGPGFGGGRHR